MKVKRTWILAVFVWLLLVGSGWAQDLDPQIKKFRDGIYAYVGKNLNSNCGIILTQDGVVLIDSGHNPTDSRAILQAVKKLTRCRCASSSTPNPTPIIRPAILSFLQPPLSSPPKAPANR